MPDRSVVYSFVGNFTSLKAGLTAAGRSVDDFGGKLTALDKNGAKMRQGLTTIGNAAGKIGLAAAVGLGAIVAVTANFEKSMSKVQAATGESAAGMEKLREAALQAGADTAFSASQAAEGIEALAKAGISTNDILGGGLTGALDLAAAGELDVANAAEIAATAMSQFGLAGADVPHIADLLAAGAGKAQGSVEDMAAALNQSGLIADQVGLSIEETAGALAAFAEKGLLGSDAGTSFKTMLGALTPNSVKAKEAMEELGISAYDSQGNFVGLTEFAGNLKESLSGLTDQQRQAALETIFGSDAVRAAAIIYEDGAEGIQSWIDKTNDSGYAAEQAATKLDNLAGDFEALKGSLETALIGAGSSSQGPLRQLVQGLTNVVNAFNDLPGPAKSATTALLAVTGILGGGLWATSKVVNGISAAGTAIEALGGKAITTRGFLTAIGRTALPLAAVAASVTLINKAINEANSVDASTITRDLDALSDGRLTDNLDKLGDSFKKLAEDRTDYGTVFGQSGDELVNEAKTLFGAFGDTAIDTAVNNIKSFDEALAGMVEAGDITGAADAFADIKEQADAAGVSAEELAKAFEQYGVALRNAGEDVPFDTLGAALYDYVGYALGILAPTDEAAGATEGLGNSAKDAAAKIKQLTQSMLDQANAAIGAFDAVTQYRQALKDARAAAEDNNAGIEGNSKKALENRNIISSLASAWNNQSAAVRNNVDKYREARTEFIEVATAMGVPIDRAIELADSLYAIPKKTVVGLDAEDKATAKITGVQRLVDFYGQTRASAQALLKDLASGKVHTVQQLVDKYGLTKAEAKALLEDAASGKLRDLIALINSVPRSKTTTITTNINTIHHETTVRDLIDRTGHADGGYITGPGGPREDKIPAYLSNGEYVVKAAAVNKYGVAMFDRLNAQRFADGGGVGFQSAVGGNQPAYLDGTRAQLQATLRDFRAELKRLAKELVKQHRILERVNKTMEKERDLRDQPIEQSAQFAESITDRLTSGLFGNLGDGAQTPQSLLDSLLGTVKGDTAGGLSWIDSLDKIDDFIQGDALQTLLDQASSEQLGLLAQLSGTQLDALERALNQRAGVLDLAGQQSADALFADGIAKQVEIFEKAFEVWEKQDAKVDAMEKRSQRLERAIPRIEKKIESIGKDVAKALNDKGGDKSRAGA